MKQKGFTLIELLAVLILIAVLTLIAYPVVRGVIDKTKLGAARTSAYGLLESTSLYYALNTINKDITFICNGEICTSEENHKLQFKGETPKSGQINAKANGNHELYYIVTHDYCILGTRDNMDIKKDCKKLDNTKAELNVIQISSTSKNITINVKAKDIESGIKKITYEIDGKTYSDNYDDTNIDINKTFNKLQSGKTYTIKVTVTNGNDLKEEKTIEVQTISMGILKVKFNRTPDKDQNEYYKKEVVYFEYEGEASIEGYYIKSTRNATSNIDITQSCGNENSPGECSNITSTKNLEENVWYYLTEKPTLTYDQSADTTATIYARITDGENITANATGTIDKIDTIAPTCSLQVTGSGVSFASKEDANIAAYGMNKTGNAEYNNVDNLPLSTGTFYGYVKDKAENTVTCSATITNTSPRWTKISKNVI